VNREPFPEAAAPHVEVYGGWAVPEVQLHEDHLVFSHQRQVGSADLYRIDPSLLTSFGSLRPEEPQAVLQFAQAWGPLGLCEHGMPHSHLPAWVALEAQRAGGNVTGAVCGPPTSNPVPWRVDTGEGLGIGHSEPLKAWFDWAAAARSLIEVADSLVRGRPAALQLWRPVGIALEMPVDRMAVWPDDLDEPDDPDPDARDYEELVVDGQAVERDLIDFDDSAAPTPERPTQRLAEVVPLQAWLLNHAVDRWLRLADVHLRLDWRQPADGPPTIRFGPTATTPIGALGLQMAMTVGGVRALAICDGCRQPFEPARQHSKEEHKYCEACRAEGVPKKMWRREQVGTTAWTGTDTERMRARRR
jgi:hypothetical protein